jgi:large subunit ribosomal protein L9
MKVILLQDVAKIGRRHQVVEVPDGYARNKLIPMRAALPATPEHLARLKAQVTQAQAQQASDAAVLLQSVEGLTATPLSITAPANEQGHLFKQVSAKDIAAAAAMAHHPLPLAALVLTEPIKSVGDHTVTVKTPHGEKPLVVTVVAAPHNN